MATCKKKGHEFSAWAKWWEAHAGAPVTGPAVVDGHLDDGDVGAVRKDAARVGGRLTRVGDHEKGLELRDGLGHVGVRLTRRLAALAPQVLGVLALGPPHPAAHMRLKLTCTSAQPFFHSGHFKTEICTGERSVPNMISGPKRFILLFRYVDVKHWKGKGTLLGQQEG